MATAATKSTALYVLRQLRKAGFEALFAGGCVRDMLLGIRCSDYDIATNATPKQVKRLFGNVLLIGAKFGVAMVIIDGRKVEVTTFRTDVSYSDGRRPESVEFTSPPEDAKRRDFTINGMFYDPPADEVIDYVSGQADLARGVIRTIGDPNERFGEDYLRMIRAVRFAVRLDFKIAAKTAAGVTAHAAKIKSISGERIFDELSKMLAQPSAGRALAKMASLGLAQVVLSDLFAKDLWVAAVDRVEYVAGRADLVLTLGAMLIDLAPAEIEALTRRWGTSNELREGLCWMARLRDRWRDAAEIELCQFKRILAGEHFSRLKRLWRFDELAQSGKATQSRRIAIRAGRIEPEAIAPGPLVTGDDLLKMGLKQGAKLGRILKELYNAQLNEQLTTRRGALSCARKLVESSVG